jgi:hypothetical protein
MGEVRALPRAGEVFVDIRGEDRTMRISHHDDLGVVVISLWVSGLCRASFRLPLDDAPNLIAALSGPSAPGQAAPADEPAPRTAAGVESKIDNTADAA